MESFWDALIILGARKDSCIVEGKSKTFCEKTIRITGYLKSCCRKTNCFP